jgi:uncharacterized membrane protein
MHLAQHILKYAALIGMLLSFFLLYTHFQGTPFCLAGNHQVCDAVNQSIWSELAGIPVAAWGAETFAFLFIAIHVLETKKTLRIKRHHLRTGIVLLSASALGFEAYITYKAKTVMGLLCPYCLIIFGLLIIIFICALITKKQA